MMGYNSIYTITNKQMKFCFEGGFDCKLSLIS